MDSDEHKHTNRTEVHETKSDDGRVEHREVTETDHDRPPRKSNIDIAVQVVYYVGGVIMSILAIRLLLALLGANRGNPFADFVFDVSAFFAWPFFGLFSYEPQNGVSVFELSTLVAIVVYGLLTVAVAKLLLIARQ